MKFLNKKKRKDFAFKVSDPWSYQQKCCLMNLLFFRRAGRQSKVWALRKHQSLLWKTSKGFSILLCISPKSLTTSVRRKPLRLTAHWHGVLRHFSAVGISANHFTTLSLTFHKMRVIIVKWRQTLCGLPRRDPHMLCMPLVCRKAAVSQASAESQNPGSRINEWSSGNKK